MKSIILLSLILLFSLQSKQEINSHGEIPNPILHNSTKVGDTLFKLDLNLKTNAVRIIAPEKSNFVLPDLSSKTKIYKLEDFNADKKEDVLVSLGACGTGGCMYGLFLNQYDNFYKMVFMDYLNGLELKKQKNGLWALTSFEEIEPYNPSKLQVSVFKFDENKYQYKLDSTYMYRYKEVEK